MDLDAAIREAAAQMEARIPAKTMVALVSVASPSTAFSSQVLTRLESAIVSSGKLVVVDRANLDKVREEQGFQLSGEVDDDSAKAIGKLLGAGAIVTGTLTDLGDVYSLALKAINIDTAMVAVSYLADLTKSARVETLLASGDGTGTGTRTVQTGGSASATPTAASAPVQSSPNDPSYKVGGKGPAGGLIFYTTDVSYTAPPPVNREYQAGQNGPAGGVVFYPAAHVQTPPKVDREYQAGQNGPAGGVVFYPAANVQTSPKVDREYQIGDTGPAGGIIFYINPQSGDWKYLEAAPASAEFTRNWGLHGKTVRTDVTTGSGKENTKTIVAALENNGEIGAALLCVDLSTGGYRDWFLPSKAELNLMYRNLALKSLGKFEKSTYWSSSGGDDSGAAWIQNLGDGVQVYNSSHYSYSSPYPYRRDSSHLVRAIRQF
jgi:hypothetical protein